MINDRRFKMFNFTNYTIDEFELQMIEKIEKLKKTSLKWQRKIESLFWKKKFLVKRLFDFMCSN